jgi:hypothetical protein
MKAKRVAKVLGVGIVALTVTGVVLGEAVLHLWNALMPEIFGLRPIGFWQALGLMALSWILFGGLGMFHGKRGPSSHWRHRMAERWEQMPPEEREKFAQGLRGRCGRRGGPMEEGKSA